MSALSHTHVLRNDKINNAICLKSEQWHMNLNFEAKVLSFSSSPTPIIKWFKKGGELPGQKVKFENFNKTLKIVSVSEEDAGEYVCMANNHLGTIRHSIFVQVKGE